jgi:hypothetical protein
VIKVDEERKIIPFDILKKRRTLRKKYKEYHHETLLQLVVEYHEQCNELFDLCIKSRKLLIQYRERYTTLHGLYTKARELIKHEQQHTQEAVGSYSLMKSFIEEKGLENEFKNFIWNPRKK